MSERERTDESLQVEREKADTLGEGLRAVEAAADDVVRVARQRADDVVQRARDEADAGGVPACERTRARADVLLEQERSAADAVVEHERVEKRSYLAAFLEVERETTDQDLLVERAQADTAVAARDEFLAAVSHDMRTMLGGLVLNMELLGRRAPEGAAGDLTRKHTAMSRRLVARLTRLVNDLLDVASIEAGKLALVAEEVDVDRIVRETHEAFEPIAAVKRITLDVVVPESPLVAWLDGERVLQVLANLVSNAIKFTPPEGHVSIRVSAEGSEVQFAVKDDGIGVPQEALPGLFERFRQVSRDRRGLGLGLHISKCIVEAQGGRLWAESEPGVGSTFYFALPAGT